MTVIKVAADSTLPAERVLQAARDFSDERESTFPAVSVKRMNVHDLRQTKCRRDRRHARRPDRQLGALPLRLVDPRPRDRDRDRLKRLRQSRKQVGDHSHAQRRWRKPCRDDLDPRVQARTQGGDSSERSSASSATAFSAATP